MTYRLTLIVAVIVVHVMIKFLKREQFAGYILFKQNFQFLYSGNTITIFQSIEALFGSIQKY